VKLEAVFRVTTLHKLSDLYIISYRCFLAHMVKLNDNI